MNFASLYLQGIYFISVFKLLAYIFTKGFPFPSVEPRMMSLLIPDVSDLCVL